MMTEKDIKTVLEFLHKRILHSKFAEEVTEAEMLALAEVVDLIESKNAEIDKYKEKEAETIEKVKVAMLMISETRDCVLNDIKKAKTEAIKEFAERLKAKMLVTHKSREGYCVYEFDDDLIDNLVKEMAGE